MAFIASPSVSEPRSWAEGPWRYQVLTYSVASGDTSGTITADRLSSVMHVFLDGGLILTAEPTFSNNVVTLAFSDPGATRYGTILVIGR